MYYFNSMYYAICIFVYILWFSGKIKMEMELAVKGVRQLKGPWI